MKLVIIEGIGKKDTIKKYLGSGYQVMATGGHFRDSHLYRRPDSFSSCGEEGSCGCPAQRVMAYVEILRGNHSL